jgi:hypothetical protein
MCRWHYGVRLKRSLTAGHNSMAFKQYTSCVSPGNYVDLGFNPVGISQTILLVLTFGFIAFAVLAIAGGPVAIVAAIALVSAIIVYLNWWLFGRLICLGDDPRNCAIIGMVVNHGPSNPLDKAGDNDYTMNILLAPGPTDYNEDKSVYWLPPQGHLVAENAAILSIGRGYVQDGSNLKYVKSLHCEFEGDGIRSLLDAAYGVLAMLLAALAVPGLWIVAIIIALLVIINKIFGSPGAPGSGNPLDIDPSLGTLTGRDLVVVKGEWVYDSLHGGWNEIHPVRDCQIIGHLEDGQEFKDFSFTDLSTNTVFTLDTVEHVEIFREFWCGALKGAEGAEDGGNRDNPEHDWGIHPAVDGCKKPDIIL